MASGEAAGEDRVAAVFAHPHQTLEDAKQAAGAIIWAASIPSRVSRGPISQIAETAAHTRSARACLPNPGTSNPGSCYVSLEYLNFHRRAAIEWAVGQCDQAIHQCLEFDIIARFRHAVFEHPPALRAVVMKGHE